jgi:integrase
MLINVPQSLSEKLRKETTMNQYHIYQHKKQLKSGTTHRWYYYHYDQTGRKIQKACKGCNTKLEAELFVVNLQIKPPSLIASIASDMFLPTSQHVQRRKQLGKSTTPDTMTESRRYTTYIINQWGNLAISDLSPAIVMNFLFNTPRSGKWKNRFIEILNEVFSEANWQGVPVPKLNLPRFAPNVTKADTLSADELTLLFHIDNFPSPAFLMLFITCFHGGLRLGEARAVTAKQLITDRSILIIDGFCKKDGTRTNYNKKGSKDNPRFRIVYLPPSITNILQQYIALNSINPDGFLFTLNGKPIRQETAEDVFYRALQKIGVIPTQPPKPRAKRGSGRQTQSKTNLKSHDGRKLVPHSLRYSFISMMRQLVTPHDLKPITGHTSDVMVDYYNRKALDITLSTLPPSVITAANQMPQPRISLFSDTLEHQNEPWTPQKSPLNPAPLQHLT